MCADPVGELGFLHATAFETTPTDRLGADGYKALGNNAVNSLDPLGLTSLCATFWAALAKGDLQTATLILGELAGLGEATPAMQQALSQLQKLQKVAEILSKVTIKWGHANIGGRLKGLTYPQAQQAVASTIAGGGLRTWLDGAGQTIFAGTFNIAGVMYSFTGRISPVGLYEIGTIVIGPLRGRP